MIIAKICYQIRWPRLELETFGTDDKNRVYAHFEPDAYTVNGFRRMSPKKG